MDHMHAWLSHHRLPKHLTRTLHRYFKSYLKDKSAVDEAQIWHELTPELQQTVGKFIIHQDVLHNPLFDGLGTGPAVRLQSILQSVHILPNRTVTTKGEAGIAMYFILSG